MKKKTVRRGHSNKPSVKKHSRKKDTLDLQMYSRYIIATFGIVLLFVTGRLTYSATQKPHVLGASVLLAADSLGSNSHETSGNSGNLQEHGGNSVSTALTGIVDCTGPDGKHFPTAFKNCSDLNHAWHHDNFSFTSLHATTPAVKVPRVPSTELAQNDNKDASESGVGTPGAHMRIKINEGMHRGDVVNNSLKENDIEIGTQAASGFSFRKGNIEAKTNFPVSINPKTKVLTVTTPAGIKTVTVLPDQAIANVLKTKIIDSIENEASLQSSSGAVEKVNLTQLNNEPVFEVKGLANKKVFGIIPVSFAKAVFISAVTGNVVKTDETALSKLLEALSF